MSKLQQLAKENLKYYVYLLVDPRTSRIFYVGKGQDERVLAHFKDAVTKEDQNKKLNMIREIKQSGHEVKYYIARHGMSEGEALTVESVLIDLLTHSEFNLLEGLTNSVKGHKQEIYGIKTIEEIEAQYNSKPLEVIKHNLISININKLYNNTQKISLYDATRGYWVLDPKKANQADFVVSEYKGVIRAIFKVNENGWQNANNEDVIERGIDASTLGKNRYYFTGTEVTEKTDKEITDLYLYKSLDKNPGEANPIKYFFKK